MLSEHHQKQKFVLKIEPADPAMRKHANLTLVSTPLRSVTKLRPSGHSTSPSKQSTAAPKGTNATLSTPTTDAAGNAASKRPVSLHGSAVTAGLPIDEQPTNEQLRTLMRAMRAKIQQLEADNMDALKQLSELRREKENEAEGDGEVPLRQEEDDDVFATLLQDE